MLSRKSSCPSVNNNILLAWQYSSCQLCAGDDLIVGLIKNLIYAIERAIALEIQSFIVLPRTFAGVLWVTLEGSFCCARVFWVRNHTEFLLWGLRRLFSHRLGCIREMSKLVSCHTCLLCPLLSVCLDRWDENCTYFHWIVLLFLKELRSPW